MIYCPGLSVPQRSSSQVSVSPGRQQMAQTNRLLVVHIIIIFKSQSSLLLLLTITWEQEQQTIFFFFSSNLDYEDVPGVTGRQNMVYCPRRYCHPPSQSLSLDLWMLCCAGERGLASSKDLRILEKWKMRQYNLSLNFFDRTERGGLVCWWRN